MAENAASLPTHGLLELYKEQYEVSGDIEERCGSCGWTNRVAGK
jgi:hypothetical protein